MAAFIFIKISVTIFASFSSNWKIFDITLSDTSIFLFISLNVAHRSFPTNWEIRDENVYPEEFNAAARALISDPDGGVIYLYIAT